MNYLKNFNQNPMASLQQFGMGQANLKNAQLNNEINQFKLGQMQQLAQQNEMAQQQAQAEQAALQQALMTGDISQLSPQGQQQAIEFMNMRQSLIDKDAGRTAFMLKQAIARGDFDGAKQIAIQNQDDINALGDPSFTIDQVIAGIDNDPESIANMANGVMQLTGFNPSGEKPLTAYQAQQTRLREAELQLAILREQRAQAESKVKQEQIDQKIKQQEEKIKKDKQEGDLNIESAIDQAQDTVNLIDRIMKSPGFDAAVGTKGASSLFGILEKPLAGTDAADTAALIETLESQNFLNAIQQMKGLGALSNAEGQKVSSAVQNLSRNQSEKQLKANLNEVIRITKRAIENANKKLGKTEVKNSDITDTNTFNWAEL